MFGGSTSTEYDDIVAKTTDENLTSENWELILNLCDKVGEEGQAGAHAVVAAILKRLAHRNPNVQLYALSLSDSLSKNLGIEVHREISSRAFTQGLEKLITDRNTHEKVRRRALALIAEWSADFENDETLGIMEECYSNLKGKNYKFEQQEEAPPPSVDMDAMRKEEEELQRVLEMSKADVGRSRWGEYSLANTPAGPSGSSSSAGPSGASSTGAGVSNSSQGPKYAGGYVPARTPTPERMAAQQREQKQQYEQQLQEQQRAQHQREQEEAARLRATAAAAATSAPPKPQQSVPSQPDPTATLAAPANVSAAANVSIVTRVKALYTFEPTEPGELAFEAGEIIKVVDRGYKDWWRGQLKGRTGIFPVNYVEAMPEPTVTELAKEAEQEAAVFAQALNVEKLLNMLRALDPARDNLADNEEIQELYRSSMALRPKIVKLIDKYSQKRADLVSMNETFLRARNIFDRMMEESLARHTGLYDQQPSFRPPGQYQQGLYGRTGSRQSVAIGGPQYPWGPGFAPPQSQATPAPGFNAYPGTSAPSFPIGPQPTATPAPGPQSLGQQGPYAPGPGQQPQSYAPQQVPQQQAQPQQQGQPPAATPEGYGVMAVGGYAGHQPNTPYSHQGPTPYPVQQQQQPPAQPAQGYQQPQAQTQPQQQAQPYQQQQQTQPYQQQLQNQPPQLSQPYQAPSQGQQPQVQPIQQSQPQLQPQLQAQAQAQPQPQPQAQPQSQPLQPQPYQQPQNQSQPYQQPQDVAQAQAQPSPQQQPQSYQQPIQHPGLSPQPSFHQPGPLPVSQPQVEPQPQPIQAQVQPVQSQPVVQTQVQPQVQPQVEPHPQSQTQTTQLPQQTPQPQPLPQAQVEPQPAVQSTQDQAKPTQPITGSPPFQYDPSYTYADPNVQLWATYYAQGGTDLQGAVYFISIPGVKEAAASSPIAGPTAGAAQLPAAARQQSHISPQRQNSHPVAQGQGQASPIQQQHQPQFANVTRYQLSDNPVSLSEPPQISNGSQTSLTSASPSASPTPASLSPGFTSTAPLHVKRAQSPNANVPSWVLPKKSNTPGLSGGGGSPPAGGGYFQSAVGS